MAGDTAAVRVQHNEAEQQFQTTVEGQLAVAAYTRDGNTLTFTHTEVPEEFQGQGIGNALASAALQYARAENATVVPLCGFIGAYIESHPEYQSLVRDV